MNNIKNKSIYNLNYINIYNSNAIQSESISTSQMIEKSIQMNEIYRNRNRTAICKHIPSKNFRLSKGPSARPKSLLKKKTTKYNRKFNLLKIKLRFRNKSSLKKLKILETEKKNTKCINICRINKRAKSIKPSFSSLYTSFNRIFTENTPVTVKVINILKNQKLADIFRKINANIDNKTFIILKYIKNKGDLYIKFRNIYYYNYYYSYFKGKVFFGNKILQMIKIEENHNLWTVNSDKEEIFIPKIINGDDFFYQSYIRQNFKRIFLLK